MVGNKNPRDVHGKRNPLPRALSGILAAVGATPIGYKNTLSFPKNQVQQPNPKTKSTNGDSSSSSLPTMPGSQPREFVAHPNGYHKYTAHVLAKLSGFVYNFTDEAELLEQAQEFVSFDTVSTFGRNGNEAIIFENQECAVVVWRGSATARDWKDNLKVGVNEYEIEGVRGKIYKGFWNHTDREWREDAPDGVSAKLQQLTAAGTSRKVFFTGHSLGGACAVVSACRFIKEQNGLSKLAQTVTFGQPKTVDENIADFLSKRLSNKYFRFVRSGDLVPLFPSVLSLGGVLKFITSKPVIYTDPPRKVVYFHYVFLRGNGRSSSHGASDGTRGDVTAYHKICLYSEGILSPEKETLWKRFRNKLRASDPS